MTTTMKKKSARRTKNPRTAKYTASTADRHVLYQMSVQNVEAEIDFVDEAYEALRGRNAQRLREDFCGTGHTSCEWAERRETNEAVGLDIDPETLKWGEENNLSKLSDEAKSRVLLLDRNVMDPGKDADDMDIILAMNFSYWILKERTEMICYFKAVYESLKEDGIFFLDFYGGTEAHDVQEEDRDVGPFTYVWDQNWFDPITHHMQCYIHFKFRDGSRMNRAFSYQWRLWNMPEIREMLAEAGFSKSTVYLEGDDGEGGGDGDFKPVEVGEVCAAWLAYIVAEK